MVVAVVGVTVLAAAAYIVLRSSAFEATANVLVAPLAEDDPAFVGLPLIRPSSDGTRPVETGTGLLQGPAIAKAVSRRLGGQWTRNEVASALLVTPRGGSDLIAVTAKANTGPEAARVANAYVEEALDLRRRALAPLLYRLIVRTSEQVASAPNKDLRFQFTDRLKRLRSARQLGDPTLAQVSRAIPPTTAATRPAWMVLAVAVFVGLLIGLGAAALRRDG